MKLAGYIWEGDDDGHLVKVDVTVERTDTDEIAIFGREDEDDGAEAAIYVSVDTAVRLATMLGIAAYANEIQAHEEAKIIGRDA